VEIQDVNTELLEIQESITALEQEMINIQKQETEIEKILDRKKIFEEQLFTEQKSFLEIQKILTIIFSNLHGRFSPDHEDEFEKKRSDSFALEKRLKKRNGILALERETEKENLLLENINRRWKPSDWKEATSRNRSTSAARD
jgi:exonuclease SbcC